MYRDIVFMQGDEGRELVDSLCNVEGVVAHGATDESIDQTIEYLSQWDNGVDGEVFATVLIPDNDKSFENGEWLLTWNLGLGYVGLYHKD